MTLRELQATFIRYEKSIAGPGHGRKKPDGSMQWGGFEVDTQVPVENLSDAQGINFLCPLCFEKNNGPVGTHTVSISFEGRNVSDSQGSKNDKGEPSRWNILGGSGLDDLRLSPSILLSLSPCQWHGYIGNSGVEPGHAR